MPDYKTFAFGPDLSHYDAGTLAEKTAKYRGVDFIIAKVGGSEDYRGPAIDARWNDHAQLAWDLDVPLIGYWFANPRTFLEGQLSMDSVNTMTNEAHPIVSKILQALRNGATGWKRITELYLDYEEASYWSDPKWPVNDVWMRFYIEDVRNRLKGMMGSGKLPKFEIGVYSRKSFVDARDNNDHSIQQYLIGRPELSIWSASYPREVSNALSVAEIKANWLPLDTWKPYQFGSSPARSLPVAFWQFAGDVDWNVAMQTPAQLYARLGFAPHGVTPPPVEPPPVEPPTSPDLAALTARVAELEAWRAKIKAA